MTMQPSESSPHQTGGISPPVGVHSDCRRLGYASSPGHLGASRSLVRPMGHRHEEFPLVDDQNRSNANPPVLVEKFEGAAATVVGCVERPPTDYTAVAGTNLARPGEGPENHPDRPARSNAPPPIAHPRLHHSWYTEIAEHQRRKYCEDPRTPRAHCSSCAPRGVSPGSMFVQGAVSGRFGCPTAGHCRLNRRHTRRAHTVGTSAIPATRRYSMPSVVAGMAGS